MAPSAPAIWARGGQKKKIKPNDAHFSFFEDALAKIKEEIIDEKIGFSNLVITIIKLIEIVEINHNQSKQSLMSNEINN